MELFKIFGTIALKGKEEFGSGLDDASGKAKKFADTLQNGLGKAAQIGAKAVTAAVPAAGTAIGFVVKNAIESYSEYEQLVGGVETLFKDSAGTVMQYAENAYQTAGLSANEYMDTVTSFSASLLQSLGGDTAQAAEMANLAVTDMSDNANKMGTDMTMIQNAYQGFAKQNYTMLDNLELGYGGTKEEMQRLIDDANELNATQGKLTNYSIDSFADIVSAIHDVQTEMGITGTTAKEAATTIQGSISSAKAAWENWLTALGDGNADIEAETKKLMDAIGVAASNLLPVFEQVLSSLGQALSTKLPELLSQAVSFVVSHLPDILSLGLQLVLALIDGLGQGFSTLLGMMGDWLQSSIVEPIKNKFEEAKTTVSEKWESIKTTTAEKWESIKTTVSEKAEAIAAKAKEKFEEVKSTASEKWEAVKSTTSEKWEAIKSTVQEKLEPIVSEAKAKFEEVKAAASEKWESIKAATSEKWEAIRSKVFEKASAMVEQTKGKFEEIKSAASEKWTAIKDIAAEKWESIRQTVQDKVDALKNFLPGAWDSIKSTAQSALSALTGILTQPFQAAYDAISGIVGKIKSAVSSVASAVSSVASTVSSVFGGSGGSSVSAHAAGGVLTKPTIFGYTPSTNTYHLGGEAGAEAIAPIGVLQGYVAAAVASQNDGIANALNRLADAIIDMDANMGGNLREALNGTSLSINQREFGRLVRGVT